jgi:hypothetical protein
MKAAGIGLLSGSLMGLFLWFVEQWTGHTVYTLLVNVDYLPGFRDTDPPDWIEFGLHLVVSVAVCMAGDFASKKGLLGSSKRGHAIRFGLVMVLIGVMLYPTTMLAAEAPTPLMNNVAAWGWWLLGHAAYGVGVGFFLSDPKK